jgi:hypothetical protein
MSVYYLGPLYWSHVLTFFRRQTWQTYSTRRDESSVGGQCPHPQGGREGEGAKVELRPPKNLTYGQKFQTFKTPIDRHREKLQVAGPPP